MRATVPALWLRRRFGDGCAAKPCHRSFQCGEVVFCLRERLRSENRWQIVQQLHAPSVAVSAGRDIPNHRAHDGVIKGEVIASRCETMKEGFRAA